MIHEVEIIPERRPCIMMNKKQKAGIAVCAAGAAGLGLTYGALYYRAMHPGIQKPVKGKRKIACVGDSLT